MGCAAPRGRGGSRRGSLGPWCAGARPGPGYASRTAAQSATGPGLLVRTPQRILPQDGCQGVTSRQTHCRDPGRHSHTSTRRGDLRTALDVFVWANSWLLPEAQRGQAAYPIPRVGDEDGDVEEPPHRLEHQPKSIPGWVEGKVKGLPEPLRSRVVGNMRWASLRYQDHLVWHQRLPLIRELDDIDKHRLALELEATQNSATWAVRARDAGGAPVTVDVHWNLGREIPTRAGERVVIATGAPERRVASIAGAACVGFGLRVRLFDLSLDVRDSLQGFIDDVDGLFDVLSVPEDSLEGGG